MAHNLYCDSYHIHNMTYQLYYCNYIRVKNVKCVISWGRCSMIGLIVVMSVVVVLVLPLFSFPVDGLRWGWGWGWGWGVPVHLFFVVLYCFLFWIDCDLSNSAIMKSDLLCSVVRV